MTNKYQVLPLRFRLCFLDFPLFFPAWLTWLFLVFWFLFPSKGLTQSPQPSPPLPPQRSSPSSSVKASLWLNRLRWPSCISSNREVVNKSLPLIDDLIVDDVIVDDVIVDDVMDVGSFGALEVAMLERCRSGERFDQSIGVWITLSFRWHSDNDKCLFVLEICQHYLNCGTSTLQCGPIKVNIFPICKSDNNCLFQCLHLSKHMCS